MSAAKNSKVSSTQTSKPLSNNTNNKQRTVQKVEHRGKKCERGQKQKAILALNLSQIHLSPSANLTSLGSQI